VRRQERIMVVSSQRTESPGWHNVGNKRIGNKRWNAWDLPLDHPIEVEGGRLVTLGDVGEFILALPAPLRDTPAWVDAIEAVLAAAESGNAASAMLPVYMALILSGELRRLDTGHNDDVHWKDDPCLLPASDAK
jgi:hypothetical protein